MMKSPIVCSRARMGTVIGLTGVRTQCDGVWGLHGATH